MALRDQQPASVLGPEGERHPLGPVHLSRLSSDAQTPAAYEIGWSVADFVEIYWWPDDGSRVLLWPQVAEGYSKEPWIPGDGFLELQLQLGSGGSRKSGTLPFVRLVVHPREQGVVCITNESLDVKTEHGVLLPNEKILGFLLDAGAVRRPGRSGLVGTHQARTTSVVPYPRWVPDDLWGRRYDLAHQRNIGELGRVSVDVILGLKKEPPFLGHLGGFSIQRHLDPAARPEQRIRYHAHWNDSGSAKGWSVEEATDAALEEALILPESLRSTWEADCVEYGEWLCPSAEEVQLFKVVGEPLPLFWGFDRTKEWLSER